jgi:Uma2 family endonuclease
VTQPVPRHTSYADYAAQEETSPEKHEYLRGEVLAMAGGTPEHAALAMAVGIELGAALRHQPCRVFSSDLRIRVEETDLTTYADASVICGKLERSSVDPLAAINPVLIVEVLSDSSEAYDRGEKFAHYRRIPSLREYLLVSQRERRLELYRKNDEGRWELFEAGPGTTLPLASLGGIGLATDAVYRDPLE